MVRPTGGSLWVHRRFRDDLGGSEYSAAVLADRGGILHSVFLSSEVSCGGGAADDQPAAAQAVEGDSRGEQRVVLPQCLLDLVEPALFVFGQRHCASSRSQAGRSMGPGRRPPGRHGVTMAKLG